MDGSNSSPAHTQHDPSPGETINEDDLVVNRWRRYGKDRLYVSRPDEVKIGWWDLATDEAHPETPDDLETLTTAVASWKAAQPSDPAVRPIVDVAPPAAAVEEAGAAAEAGVPTTVVLAKAATAEIRTARERPWIDLATNEAGASVREQALAARDAAPVRTLLARALGVHTEVPPGP